MGNPNQLQAPNADPMIMDLPRGGVLATAGIVGIGLIGGGAQAEAQGFANVDQAAAAAMAAPKVGRVLQAQGNVLPQSPVVENEPLTPYNAMSNHARVATAAAMVSEAQPSAALVKDCVNQELVKPDVQKAEIWGPGKSSQTTNVFMELGATPEECRGVVSRMFQYEVIVKQTIPVHGKLRRVTVRLARFNGSGFGREEDGPLGGSLQANPHNSRELVRCSPGRAKTTARLKIRGIISDSATSQEEARKIWWDKVNIKRKKPC